MRTYGAREARAVGCQSVTSLSTVQGDVPGRGERWVPGGILRPTSQMRALPQAIRDQEPTCPCVEEADSPEGADALRACLRGI